MVPILIGSRALQENLERENRFVVEDFKVRDDADWDFIGYPDSREAKSVIKWLGPNQKIEWHNPDILYNYAVKADFTIAPCFKTATIDALACIKRSHLHRDLMFDKHITTYHKYLLPTVRAYDKFNTLEGHLKDGYKHITRMFLEARTKETKKLYPQGGPSLKKTNEEFFDDAVTKVYDHDYLHELFAYYDRPLYESLKDDSKMDQAWCEKDLWNKLAVEDKTKCVAEETFVIATERFLVPNDWNYPPKLAFLNALKKVCTTLTRGYFRDHAIDYYPEIVNLFSTDKFLDVKQTLKGN